MPEVRVDVKPVRVDYLCDSCGVGEMKLTGVVLPRDPPLYPAKCEKCGFATYFERPYPTIEYVVLDPTT